jgi:hypothetical protein
MSKNGEDFRIEIAALVSMGFSMKDVTSAMKLHDNNPSIYILLKLDRAAEYLLNLNDTNNDTINSPSISQKLPHFINAKHINAVASNDIKFKYYSDTELSLISKADKPTEHNANKRKFGNSAIFSKGKV